MTFSLLDIEIIISEGIYSIGFCLVKNWEKEWARYLLGINYYDGLITIHILFKEFDFVLPEGPKVKGE